MVTMVEHIEQHTTREPVVCRVDGSPEASDAVAGAIARCEKTGAALELVAVLHTGDGAATSRDEQVSRVQDAQGALIAAIGAARRAGIEFTATSRCC